MDFPLVNGFELWCVKEKEMLLARFTQSGPMVNILEPGESEPVLGEDGEPIIETKDMCRFCIPFSVMEELLEKYLAVKEQLANEGDDE